MESLELFYKRFCKEGFDENGVLNYFAPKYDRDFNFTNDIVDEIARNYPDKLALVWCNENGDEKSFTFGQIKEYADKCAKYFQSHGIKKGDMVMLVLKRHYQYWGAALGLHKLGAVVIPATHLLTVKDLVYRFNAATVKAIVCTPDGELSQYAEEAMKECKCVDKRFIVRGPKDGWEDFDAGVAASDGNYNKVSVNAFDPFLMYFTSGTTGHPKMVLHDNTYPLGHIVTSKHWHNSTPDGLHLTVADTGWAKAGWGKLYGQWIIGTAIFVYDYDKFDANALLEIIEKYKITTFCAPATIYRFFVKEGLGGHDLSSLKYASIAGEALNAEVFERFREYTGIMLMEGFGQSESVIMLGNLVGSTPKPGSMGKPIPLYDIDLVDADGESVEAGVVGEIVIRLPKGKKQIGLLTEYYRNEERTYEAMHDGLYHTGDTAWKDQDGYYWYVGRTDDLIKSSGYRIGPFEIESVLMEHPAVLECAITGVPDPVRGQVVKATIVLTSQFKPSDELAKELQEHTKHLTAPYKYPRIVEFVSDLPKTISGKIKRKDIREK